MMVWISIFKKKKKQNPPGCYCICNIWKKAKNIVKILFSKVKEKYDLIQFKCTRSIVSTKYAFKRSVVM